MTNKVEGKSALQALKVEGVLRGGCPVPRVFSCTGRVHMRNPDNHTVLTSGPMATRSTTLSNLICKRRRLWRPSRTAVVQEELTLACWNMQAMDMHGLTHRHKLAGLIDTARRQKWQAVLLSDIAGCGEEVQIFGLEEFVMVAAEGRDFALTSRGPRLEPRGGREAHMHG